MLSLYDSFAVPDVPNVMLYRDDEAPHKFYMVSERATIARDDEGQPLFTFLLYARDVDRLAAEDREVERGYIAITTQAAVPKAAEDKIRAYLRQKLRDERTRNTAFLGNPVTDEEPELGYPPLWLEGTVEFHALGPDMVPFSAGSQAPSLIDTNIASFSAQLNQDGAELFRQSLEKGIMPAGVWYNLAFAARIPAITIHITGNRGEFYKEVRNYIRQLYTTAAFRASAGAATYRRSYIYEWDALSSITTFRNTFHNLTIAVDDSSLPGADRAAMKDKLEEMAFQILQTNILPGFFEPAIKEVAQDQASPPPAASPGNQEITGSLDVTITRTELVPKKVNPSVILSQALTPAEVKAGMVYVDLSQPFFQELDVFINSNVNFTADPVFGLKVFVDYDQQDDVRHTRVKRAKEFLFRSADTVARFRQVMAKGPDGAPKDTYHYWSEISYKDTGETIRVPATGALEARERQLIISYRRLGFVKVNLLLGALPETVRAVQVQMRYPDYTGPSGRQTLELTKDKPTATFFTYTGQGAPSGPEPGPYRYQISYVLADGQRMELPEESGQAETLTIRDPFEQTATTRFLAQADFTVVQKILVDAQYRDPAHDYATDHHAEFSNNGETSTWTTALRDPSKRDFTYTVTIIYRNGARSDQAARPAALGASIPVGEGAVDALEITVIASTADWTKLKLALVYLQYDDAANTIHQEKQFTFRPDTAGTDQTWKVLLRDKTQKTYSYHIRYIGVNSADNREVPWTPSADPILVLD